MSRPKTVNSKTRSKTRTSECKPAAETKPAAKTATPDAAPDQKEHRAEAHKEIPAEEQPWSEWLWCDEAQLCYRGRKNAKGEWDYEYEPLKPLQKERPYTPRREEPIEYLIEELKIIWGPKPVEVLDCHLVTVTAASANNPSKVASEGKESAPKAKVKVEEGNSAEDKEEKVSKGDDKESKISASRKPEKHEKHKKEKHAERRGRQLERKHFNQERKEKVEGWRKGLE